MAGQHGNHGGLARITREIDQILTQLGCALVAYAQGTEPAERSQAALRDGVERLLHLVAERASLRSGGALDGQLRQCRLDELLGSRSASTDPEMRAALQELRAEVATIRGQLEALQIRLERQSSTEQPLPLQEARPTRDPRKQGALAEIFRRNLALRAAAMS